MGEALGSGYVLDRPIGRGAMGEVWRALDVRTDEEVAAKLLRPELATDPELVARFLQERSILESLRGEHLVSVRDLVAERDRLAIIMDLIDGTDLRKRLRLALTLSPGDAAALTAQVCSALAIVHTAGVVHRDVKPENVLLDESGSAHLSDFGVSRIAHGASLTRLTTVVGTPNYLAPELARSNRATPAADIYAVGIMLYELLAGRTPFAGGDPMAVLMRHQIDEPPELPGCPPALQEVLGATLHKDPSARPDAVEVQRAMEELSQCLVGIEALTPMSEPDESDYVPTSTSAPGRALTPRIGALAGTERPESTFDGNDDESAATRLRVPTGAAGASPTAPAAPVAHSKRRRAGVVVGAAAIVLAVVLVAAMVGRSPTARATPTAFKPAAFDFPPALLANKLVVARTWSLATNKGDRLDGKLHVTNTTGAPLTATVDEVIPKSVAASVDSITFQPQPIVVKRDPVVQYALADLPAGGSIDLTYTAQMSPGPNTVGRLGQLAADQARAQEAEIAIPGAAPAPVTLKALSLSTRTGALKVNDTLTLTATGTMTDDSPAPAAVLIGLSWSSANPSVATVSNGLVTGAGEGTTTVSASIGLVHDDAAIAVALVAKPALPAAPPTVAPITTLTTLPTLPSPPSTTLPGDQGPLPNPPGNPGPTTSVLSPTPVPIPTTPPIVLPTTPPVVDPTPTSPPPTPPVTTLPLPPAPHINGTTQNDSGGSATITWDPPPDNLGITAYRMRRDGIDAHDVGDWSDEFGGARTSFTHTNLAPGNAYHLYVRAINATGPGPEAAVLVVMGGKPGPAPVQPQSFKVVRDPTGLTATITWDRPLSNGGSRTTAYQVDRDGTDINSVGLFPKVIGIPAGPPYTFVFTNLVPNQTYNFSVAAVNALGRGVVATLPA